MRTDTGKAIHLAEYTVPDYLIDTVNLSFKLHETSTIVESVLSIRPNPLGRSGAPLVMDGDELNVQGVWIDGRQLPASEAAMQPDFLVIPSPPQQPFTLRTVTHVDPVKNTQLSGLYRSGSAYCTQCEAEGFRRITYFLDRPDVLSVYTTRIEADSEQAPVLLGNGNLQESGPLEDGKHFAIWHDPFPKPSYLFAIVGGDLEFIQETFVTLSGRQVTLGIYVEKGKQSRAAYAMDALKRSMRWDEEVYGREYDLDVFNIVAVSDFNMGAMENKGLNIFNDKYILASPDTATDLDYAHIESVVAHEYFHNWTGNRITCRDWFQLCLKEGLTVFRDQEFSADQRSRTVKRIEDVRALRAAQFSEDAGPLAHNVRPETYHEINNFYTATVYQKGAEVIRMLKTLIGDKAFYSGMALYFDRYDGTAAIVENFISCFEESSNRNLDQFMLWYKQSGTPKVKACGTYNPDTNTYRLELEQILAPTPGQDSKEPQVIPVQLGLIGQAGEEVDLHVAGSSSQYSASTHEIATKTFELNSWSRTIEFTNIKSAVTPSLLRQFSSPVQLEYDFSESELLHLIANDSDAFNRWQASQNYANKLLMSSVKRIRAGEEPADSSGFSAALAPVVASYSEDPEFAAQILTLPGENDIARLIASDVDTDAVHAARQALRQGVGRAHSKIFRKIYSALASPDDKAFDPARAGERSLRAIALAMLAAAEEPDAIGLATNQLKVSTTMTEKIAALSVLSTIDSPQREELFDIFYNEFSGDHLVIDKWFGLQASIPGSSSVERVKRLMSYKDFSINNPNRLRAVISSFAFGNPTGFNSADGAGYQLVAEVVRNVDARNPQIAARLLTAFRNWRSLEAGRQQHAKTALSSLAASNKLSADVADILRRSLG